MLPIGSNAVSTVFTTFQGFVTSLPPFLENTIYIRDIKNNSPIFPIYNINYYLVVTLLLFSIKNLVTSNFSRYHLGSNFVVTSW